MLGIGALAWNWNVTAISLSCWTEPDQKAIREQLVCILNSGPFHQSQRRQRFLEYLVNETLSGRGERLKAYNVALAVFDRPETFDPVTDPLVRIEAARLREKLREYDEADGQSDPIRIELPKGTYTPHMVFRQAATPDASPDRPGGPDAATQDQSTDLTEAPAALRDDEASPASARSERRMRWQIIVPVLALILGLGALGGLLTRDLWLPRAPENGAVDSVRDVPKGPGDRGPPLQQFEWRPETRIFQRTA